jgi:hypothetical protein
MTATNTVFHYNSAAVVVYRDDLECLVYCLFEMEQPTLRLPWNHTLTTNAEAKEGWSMKQLERMSKKKKKAWLEACKQVRISQCVLMSSRLTLPTWQVQVSSIPVHSRSYVHYDSQLWPLCRVLTGPVEAVPAQ